MEISDVFRVFGKFFGAFWLREPFSELDLAESLIVVRPGAPETSTIASYVNFGGTLRADYGIAFGAQSALPFVPFPADIFDLQQKQKY